MGCECELWEPLPACLLVKVTSAGGEAITVGADVIDPAGIPRLFESTEAAYGGVDVLVNNAGIMAVANLADTDD
jgi:3-oxoacyl-[acyl-carrier protein] reductase